MVPGSTPRTRGGRLDLETPPAPFFIPVSSQDHSNAGFARNQGELLVVGLNTDRSVNNMKGPSRPVLPEQDRARIIAALEDVDYVVLFDEPTPEELIREVRPDVLIKGEDWREKGVVGREFVESYGGKVVLAPLVQGISTTDIISRIVEKENQRAQKTV
jgi:D-beta-D-heptose 7-phosphate kinase/D-beta-D-heptose 1-phosphate adenosyltransferase